MFVYLDEKTKVTKFSSFSFTLLFAAVTQFPQLPSKRLSCLISFYSGWRVRPVRVSVCVSLAEQGLQVQLQASDGGVQGVELSAFLPGSSSPVGARRPRLNLKVSVEVVASLHFAEAAGQSVMEGLSHRGGGAVERWGCGLGMRECFTFQFCHLWFFYSPR